LVILLSIMKEVVARQISEGESVLGEEARSVIGRIKDLLNLQPGEQSLLSRLPDLGAREQIGLRTLECFVRKCPVMHRFAMLRWRC